MKSQAEQLAFSGFGIVPDLLSVDEISAVKRQLRGVPMNRAGTRRLLEKPWIRSLGNKALDHALIREHCPEDPHAVQCTLFTKSSENNWLVPIHQDLSIPVAQRVDAANCSGWSEKEGEVFVQPPSEVLDGLLAVRIHLDACDEYNGALRVVPGSHRLGRLAVSEAFAVRQANGEVPVAVPAGGAMLIRPLLLHASSKKRRSWPSTGPALRFRLEAFAGAIAMVRRQAYEYHGRVRTLTLIIAVAPFETRNYSATPDNQLTTSD